MRIETVMRAGFADEVRKLRGTLPEIVQVEHSFREPAKEPRHAALEHLSSWTQHPSAGQQLRRHRDEIMFSTAGAVQHQQSRRARRRGVLVMMGE